MDKLNIKHKNTMKNTIKNSIKNNKINKHNKHNENKFNQIGSGAPPAMDLQSLTADDIQALKDQGIPIEQIAELAGDPVPPVIQAMMDEEGGMMQPPDGMMQPPPAGPSKSSKFPAMMDPATYDKYKKAEKIEKKSRIGAHKPNVFGYVFSDLISEEILGDMKRTQGSFLVGVNLSNLFNEFQNFIVSDDKNAKSQIGKKDSKGIFKRVGEWIDVNYGKILENDMGFRGSDINLLPENDLTDYSTFYEVIDESKKYASQSGRDNKITPNGLLIMTRMLFKYRKTNSQWFRVATILELIYKYLGNNQTRQYFFNTKVEIPIMALMELEEFYNTDHIFMTDKELSKFKKELNFYKYDTSMDIALKIKELKNSVPTPPI